MTNSVTKTKVSQSMGRKSRPLGSPAGVLGVAWAEACGLEECVVSIRGVESVAVLPEE
jgi:hypothetical protein